MPEDHYTPPRALPAEGARVGLYSCLRCGCALVADPGDEFVDVVRLHDEWHRRVEALEQFGTRVTQDGV